MASGKVAGPTQTASDELHTAQWQSHRWLALFARVLIFIFPLVVSILASLWASKNFPPERVGLNKWVWWLGIAIAAMFLVRGLERLLARLTPLTMLFRLSLIFPDQAPSRFSVALKTGSTRSVKRRLAQIQETDVLFSEEDTYSAQMLELVAVLAAHDRMTRGHAERVRAYSELIGEEMGLDEDDLAKLRWSALLHDMGKLHVPAEILNKEGRPSDEEWAILKGHPAKSEEYLEPLAEWLGEWRHAAVGHHERWDGEGYPAGQAGTDIPLSARIVAVADAYDVMTSTRSYKKPMPAELARQEVADKAGSQFDPVVSRAFMNIGLGDLRRTAGPLAFFSNLPIIRGVPLTNALTTAASSAVSAATAAVAVTIGAVAGPPQIVNTPEVVNTPEQLAFSEPDAPTISAPTLEGTEDQTANGSLSFSGEGPFTVTVIGGPSSGDVEFQDLVETGTTGDASFDYTPAPDSNGTDSFEVRVCDANGRCTDDLVVITVSPVNDAPAATPDSASTTTNQPVQILASDLLNNDADIDSAQLTVISVSSPTQGTVSLTNGVVTFTPNPGFVGDASFTYVASDGLAQSNPVLVTIVVEAEVPEPVANVNQPPVLTISQSASIFENASTSTFVTNGVVSAVDPDGDLVNFSLVELTNTFDIDPTTGALVLVGPSLDFETSSNYSATVIATEVGSGRQTTLPVQIAVINVNEVPAITTPAIPTVPESTPIGSPIATVAASDIDGDTLAYSIVGGTGQNVFTIDAATGEVAVDSTLDYETTTSYTLVVTVTDNGSPSLSASTQLTITIGDSNDAPVITPGQTLSVAENTTAGVAVTGSPVIATDAEGGALTYSLTDPGGHFTIDPATGQITRTATPLDHESTPTVPVTIVVTDPAGGTDTAAMTIIVLDRNDPPTIDTPPSPFTTPENQTNNIVGTVVAADEDGNTLTWVLTGPGSGKFTLDAQGNISVISPTDFETTDQYNLTVTVTDTATPGATASTPITIDVTDVNEQPLVTPGQTFTISELAPVSSPVNNGPATASDVDGDPLTFSLTDPSLTFAIDQNTGVISAVGTLDFETVDAYTVVISADDGQLTNSATATINVLDVNEAPSLFPPLLPPRVFENSAIGTSVTSTISATDPEADQLTFSMIDPSGFFAIDPATGEIAVSALGLDIEMAVLHRVIVTVDDSAGGGTGSDSISLDIEVTDQNEKPVVDPMIFPMVLEDTVPGAVVTTLTGSDPEGDILSWSITGGTGLGIFSIDPLTGAVALDVPLDYDTTPNTTTHTLTVVLDDGLLTDTVTLTVPIGDIDEPPLLDQNQFFSIDENAAVGTTVAVGPVLYSDPENDPVTWTIVDPSNTFDINAAGQIFHAGPNGLDVETSDTYLVDITATGSPAALPSTETVTVKVNNVNEPPIIAAPTSGDVVENLPVGSPVNVAISSTDPEQDAREYSIVGGTGRLLFTIDSTTGELSTGVVFNAEATGSHTLIIQVAETGTPDLFADTATLTININDINEPPEVVTGQVFSIVDDQGVNTVLTGNAGVVASTDPEGHTITHAIVGGTGLGSFTITAAGELRTATLFDYDDDQSFTLIIEATDNGSPVETSTETITVDVVSQFGLTRSPYFGQVIFNEVKYTSHLTFDLVNNVADLDFIEILNTTGGTIDLANWTISDGANAAEADSTVTTFGTLTGNQRMVSWYAEINTAPPLAPGVRSVGAPIGAMSAAAGRNILQRSDDLFLFDDQGLIVAYMAWGDSTNPNSDIGTRPPMNQWQLWDPTHEAALGFAARDSISLTPDGINATLSGCWERTTSLTASTSGNCANPGASVDADQDPDRNNSVGTTNDGFHDVPGDHLLITEFAVDGMIGNAGNNFVEIYNPTNATYDLRDFTLETRLGGSTAAIPYPLANVLLPPVYLRPGESYLIGQPGGAFDPVTGGADARLWVDLTSPELVLTIAELTTLIVVDEVAIEGTAAGYGEGQKISPFLINDAGPQSFQRRDGLNNSHCVDTDDNASDWVLRQEIAPVKLVDSPRPCVVPTYTVDPTRQLVISEIQTDLGAGKDDFIELFNSSPVAVDLTGWVVEEDGGKVADLPSGFILQPGDHFLLGGDDYTGPTADLRYTKNISDNQNVALINPAGVTVEFIGLTNGNGGAPSDLLATNHPESSQQRAGNGCAYTGDNLKDFEWTSVPNPTASDPGNLTPC